jgi:hypothetical protein
MEQKLRALRFSEISSSDFPDRNRLNRGENRIFSGEQFSACVLGGEEQIAAESISLTSHTHASRWRLNKIISTIMGRINGRERKYI